jgi:hypothetical protein
MNWNFLIQLQIVSLDAGVLENIEIHFVFEEEIHCRRIQQQINDGQYFDIDELFSFACYVVQRRVSVRVLLTTKKNTSHWIQLFWKRDELLLK